MCMGLQPQWLSCSLRSRSGSPYGFIWRCHYWICANRVCKTQAWNLWAFKERVATSGANEIWRVILLPAAIFLRSGTGHDNHHWSHPALPLRTQEQPPAPPKKDSLLWATPLSDTGLVLAGQSPSDNSNGMLPVLEVTYGTICDTGMGSLLVPPMLCPKGSGRNSPKFEAHCLMKTK